MTGYTPHSTKNQHVNKKVIFTSVITAVVIIGSFCLKEICSDNKIIDKLFGGINILLFWTIFFTVYHNIEKWLFKKNNEKSTDVETDKTKVQISIQLVSFSLFVITLFFISLRFLNGLSLGALPVC